MTAGAARTGPDGAAVVRHLMRGGQLDELAWTLGAPPEVLLDAAHAEIAALNPALAERLDHDERTRTIEYLLGRQSAGQRAGTWALLERRADARRFVLYVREALASEYPAALPPIPGLEDLDKGGAVRSDDPEKAAQRRRARRRERGRRRHELLATRRASPFRSVALQHFMQAKEVLSLPDYTSPKVVLSLWALLAVTASGLGLIVTAHVPITVFGTGFVVREGNGSGAKRVGVVAVLPPEQGRRLRPGTTLRLSLPGVQETARVQVRTVPGVVSPDQLRRRYRIEPALAAQVGGPVAVALGRFEPPEGARDADSYVGIAAELQTTLGRRSVRSLIPVLGDA